MNKLKELLIKHEGLRLKPYKDTVGKLTIGVGRNLDDIGISKDEAMLLLDNDINVVILQASTTYPWFLSLDEVRKYVVISMIFNMGLTRFSGFKNTIQLIVDKKYDLAATEMLKSKWAQQVGKRANELSNMMRTGQL